MIRALDKEPLGPFEQRFANCSMGETPGDPVPRMTGQTYGLRYRRGGRSTRSLRWSRDASGLETGLLSFVTREAPFQALVHGLVTRAESSATVVCQKNVANCLERRRFGLTITTIERVRRTVGAR